MTPAVAAAEGAGIPFSLHTYVHQDDGTPWGLEAAAKLGVPAERVFKTLLVKAAGAALAVAILPVAATLDLKACARALGVRRVVMAELAEAERATGYVAGGISPLGQKRRLPTLLDASALKHTCVFVSAGRRGLEIELAPADLLRVCGARSAVIAR